MTEPHRCSCSTSSLEEWDADGSPEKPWRLTHGSGRLGIDGHWENPCKECARKAEKRDGVPMNTYFPQEKQEGKKKS